MTFVMPEMLIMELLEIKRPKVNGWKWSYNNYFNGLKIEKLFLCDYVNVVVHTLLTNGHLYKEIY